MLWKITIQIEYQKCMSLFYLTSLDTVVMIQ